MVICMLNFINKAINNSINRFENLITKIYGEKETIQITIKNLNWIN